VDLADILSLHRQPETPAKGRFLAKDRLFSARSQSAIRDCVTPNWCTFGKAVAVAIPDQEIDTGVNFLG
jgi:hypothetical protein